MFMRWSGALVRTLLGSTLLVSLAVTPARATPFVMGDITSGVDNALAVGPTGDLHLAYYEPSGADLIYGHRVGGQWSFETIDVNGDVGRFVRLVLDGEGSPNVAYYDNTKKDLKYARRLGANNWAVETVDTTGDVGQYIGFSYSVATGVFGIAYYDATPANLNMRFASGASGSWTVTNIETAGDVGSYSSLVADPTGRFHVSYFDATNRRLRYGRQDPAGTWTLENADSTVSVSVGRYSSIAINPLTGQPGIAYYDVLNGDLKLATRPTAAWSTETVASSNRVGLYASLQFNALGQPCIAYQDSTNSDLMYSVKAGSWSTEIVEGVSGAAGEKFGQHASLALDSYGQPVIIHDDNTSQQLRIADSRVTVTSPIGGEIWQAGELEQVTWDGFGAVDLELSTDGGTTYSTVLTGVSGGRASVLAPIEPSASARVRITRASPFSQSESPDLFEIGQGIATAWWQERPLPSEDVGYTLMSLQLDANQIPAIAYVNRATGYVMFARRQGKAWRTEAVEAAVTANITGGQASLAFDPQSVPHLAYVYIAGTHFKLHHAWKTSATTWATEAVDSTKDVSGVPAIACDASGNISIAYQERSGLDLKFARKAAGVWTVDPVVDATGNAGVAASIVLDALGDPHIGYATTVAPRQVRYAHKTASGWAIETVAADPSLLANENESTPIVLRPDGSPALVYFTSDGQGNDRLYYSGRGAAGWSSELISDLGSAPYPTHHSLAIAPNGIAHVAYSNGEGELTHAVRSSTGWHFDSFEEYGAGWGCTIVIDQQGLPRIAHFLYDVAAGYPYPGHPRYTSSAVEIGNPAPGTSWPVGARRTITWDGSGAADVSLSTDGGQNYVTVATAVSGGGYAVTVPNTPSDFCKIRVERAVPWSIAATDSFFKISAYVSAGVFVVTPVPDGDGAMATWHTEPGPEDLAGYKLLRSSPGEPWRTIMPLSRATTFLDQSPRDGSHYRLVAVNNLGDELEVGEQALAPLRNLAAWPLPYRGGNLDISFRIDGAVVAGVPVDIEVLDIAGRHLHTLANGVFTPGIHHVQWNGSATGVGSLPNGMYFLRRSSPAGNETVKFVVIR